MQSVLSILRAIARSRPALWLLLALPAYPLVIGLFTDTYYNEMMYFTALWSVKFLVLTLAITPVTLVLKPWPQARAIRRWLLQRRRYFGLASFGYALLHVAYYIREIADPTNIFLELFDAEIAVGWLAFLVLAAVATTSNDAAVRKLGSNWKTLQRFVYLAAAATFIHWLMFNMFINQLNDWLIVLVLAKSVQVIYRVTQERRRRAGVADQLKPG